MPVEGRGLTSGMLWKGPRIRRVAMLPRTSIHDSAVPEGTRGSAKDGQACRFVGRPPNPVGEPDAANPHVRFDEGEVETEGWEDTRAPATERAGHTQGFPTLPRHLSTLPGYGLYSTGILGIFGIFNAPCGGRTNVSSWTDPTVWSKKPGGQPNSSGAGWWAA